MNNTVIDETGKRFGRLTVIARGQNTPDGQARWTCRCDCGNMAIVRGTLLRNGTTKSCGCYMRERASECNSTHGFTRGYKPTSEWRTWASMRQRCFNPRARFYKDYGGRGITVCERWKTFENFYADMGKRPKGKTLDRYPNNDGNYEPANCRWATPKEQANNKRKSTSNRGWFKVGKDKRRVPIPKILITIKGVTKSMSQWCRQTGVGIKTAHARMTYGWEPSRAVITPARKRKDSK